MSAAEAAALREQQMNDLSPSSSEYSDHGNDETYFPLNNDVSYFPPNPKSPGALKYLSGID